ncbi:MAG: RNB domain-containing ribonuclease [Cyanobacteria bacterium SZAS TMP-1]|nr:RNB domain-containing ribonuclease [Cyanobacteria bacterium SZAS TMP-1]
MVSRAKLEMLVNGFTPVFEPAAVEQAQHLPHRDLIEGARQEGVRDLRSLLWSSIDNVESRDLDQIEYAETLPDGTVRLLVGIADVDAYVSKGSPIDKHAAANTTSVYTGVVTFPMLPEELSFDVTSLLPDEDRRAMVVEMIVDHTGQVVKSDAYPALVRNKAKLDYVSIGKWLERIEEANDDESAKTIYKETMPEKVRAVTGLGKQLRLQSDVKERIHTLRDDRGSLTLHTPEATTVAKDGQVLDLELVETNPARELIENFMIAANIATSHFLETNGVASIRRIVKVPERWPRIVEVAAEYGEKLPDEPSAPALADFLIKRRNADPVRFPDLSLTIVKLLGRGEYIVEVPGQKDEGHFALAVNDYTHATAPNRRFSDLVTQRLLKAVMAKQKIPYTLDELNDIALNCTRQEVAEKKVERTMRKVAAAVLLGKQIGKTFDGIITGVKDAAVFVRLLKPPVEGCITHGGRGLDVGDQVTVELIHVDPEKSHIDFAFKSKLRRPS